MKQRSVIFFLIIGISLAFGQEEKKTREFVHYQQMREYFGNLYQQKKYKEAIEILENHLDRFPDHLEANAYNIAISYGQLKQYQKAMNALQYALDRSVWFNIYAFEAEFWAPFKKIEKFKRILVRNEALRQEAQKSSKPDLLVLPPEGYRKEQKYPLFIALHGGSSNIANFREVWKSEKMEKEFITAYVQSSLLVGMGRYSWTVDMEITVLCPAKPQSFNKENIIEAKARGIRGTIVTTEMDPRLSVQKEMVEVLKTEGFQYQFVVTPNIGHWFPEDLDKKIDDAIYHIRHR